MSPYSSIGMNAVGMFLITALCYYKYCVQSFVLQGTFSIGWIFTWKGYVCVCGRVGLIIYKKS